MNSRTVPWENITTTNMGSSCMYVCSLLLREARACSKKELAARKSLQQERACTTKAQSQETVSRTMKARQTHGRGRCLCSGMYVASRHVNSGFLCQESRRT